MTGICAVCGPVKLHKKGGKAGGIRCINAWRQQKGSTLSHIEPHGLSLAEARIFKEGKCCAICGAINNLCVDHDHETKKIRDVLCVTCNAGIGMFKENPMFLQRAIHYIMKHNRPHAI